MNSKKSKKIRPKAEPASQNVTSSDLSEKLVADDLPKSVDTPICDKKDSDVVVIDAVSVDTSVPAMQENTNPEEPVKPKRKKAKKKKQEEPSEHKDISATDETANQTKVALLDIPDHDTAVSDTESVTKTKSRKKKNKNKKAAEKQDGEEIKREEKLSQNLQLETLETRDVTPSPEPKTKKKNKKKKHNSESENVQCTSAFQQILEAGDVQDESLAPVSNAEMLPVEKKEESCDELEAVQPAKSKKKNKKHKKQLPTDDDKPQEEHKELADELQESVIVETSSAVVDELTPKPKAVIAKPVEKKRKKKNISMSSNDEQNRIEEKKEDLTDVVTPTTENINQNIQTTINTADSAKEGETKIQEPEISSDYEKKEECQPTTVDQLQHDSVIIKEPTEVPFTEVRPSRKKKRSSKSTSEQNDDIKSATESIFNKKEECVEDSNITPDFIHYPRSSSQQCDSNNNTVIQEINTPDEVRLGIPFLMAVPVIQGSGESPEVRSQIDPLDIEVTELEINKPTEKISPIYEPGTDEMPLMEELKQSIEKSLAELTALEKAEMDTEKQFSDLLQDIESKPDDMPVKTFEDIVLDQGERKNEKQICDTLQDSLCNPVDIPTGIPTEKIAPLNEVDIADESKEVGSEPPICPSRKDKKGKSKKRGKKGSDQVVGSTAQQSNTTNVAESSKTTQDTSKDKETKTDSTKEKGKQKSLGIEEQDMTQGSIPYEAYYEPIENFEDALTSSTEDVNQTFEMIAKEASERKASPKPQAKPEISITEPEEDKEAKKQKPVSPPKNLLGHPNIPVQSDKDDYKKEKDKPPNSMSAKVKIKDTVEIEKARKSSQKMENKIKQNSVEDTFKVNENDDFVYKYSFRKVFLPNICHVCNKELMQRVPCKYCNLVFYCCKRHKDEDWSKHQSLCFAVGTVAHLKDQKFIYANAKDITGHDYRLLRMQAILSCEKMLKRKLVPWEQEALLYPRICSEVGCREWKQGLLSDCGGCGQVAFCTDHPEHLPLSHQRWCKSYALYHKLVTEQLIRGRLEPKLPNKMLTNQFEMPEKINEVLAVLFEGKADMSDIQYATLTQIASAPLTAAFSYQISRKYMNGISKRSSLTIHVVGAELQFEADVLNKWEKFFLHLRPDVKELRVVLIGADLNPSNLPVELLSRVKLCEPCRAYDRRLLFGFEDKKSYLDYYTSEDFIIPDIVCAFNPSIDRSSVYNGRDSWPAALKCIAKLKKPFLITSFSLAELKRDVSRSRQCAPFDVISDAKYNNFSSVRPDRNFITDDEIPLLFKNYCYSVVCGA